MKKMIGMLLAMVLVVNIFSVNVFAEEPNRHVLTEEEMELLLETADAQLSCSTPNCKGHAVLVQSWTEWTYYYTYVWATYSCSECGDVWNTCIAELPNMTGEEEKEEDTGLDENREENSISTVN